jgi:hypothetical protein
MSDLKAGFAKEPVLVSPNPEKSFIIEINAFDYALNACLE